MTDSLLLKPQEIHGIRIEEEPQICASTNDDFFIYYLNGTLYTFDSTSLSNTTLPAYDSNIGNAVITSLAITPTKTLAAAGFNNSSVQIYDLTKNSLAKSYVSKDGFPITNVIFLNDSNILCVDATDVLHCYPLGSMKTLSLTAMSNMWSKNLKESFSVQIRSHVRQLLAAPVLYSRKNLFSDIICITTEDTLFISKIYTGIADKLEDLVIKQVNRSLATLVIQNSTSSLLCAYAAPRDVSLITYNQNDTNIKLLSDVIDEDPVCINFISDNTLIVIFSENSCLIISILDLQGSHTTVPISGKYIQGYNSLFVFGQLQPQTPTKLYEIKMVTFENKIDAYIEQDDLENAINLCRKAMKNDQSSISGLPANEFQKARVIERSLSPFLKSRTQKILSEGTDQDASKQASFLVNLAKELKMTDWIVGEAVDLYKEVNKLPIFFKTIISVDPDGKLFNYNSQFVELLFLNHDTLDITPFLLSLSSTVAPPKRLLQYGLDTKNSELLAKVYLEKLNDPLKCVMIYSHSNFQSVFDVLLKYIDTKTIDNANALIKWVFSSIKTEQLPHLRSIIKSERTDVIDKMKCYIKNAEKSYARQKLPLNFDQFINTTIYVCYLEKVQPTSKVHLLLSSYIIDNKIKLTKTSIKYLLLQIFNENSEPQNSEEALLSVILSNNPDNQMLESLLPLCASRNFQDARKEILLELKKYDALIKDQIISEGNGNSSQDVFLFIQKLIRNVEISKDKESLISIKKALFSNATLLISKDVNSFVDLILTYFTLKDDEKDFYQNASSSNLSSSPNLLGDNQSNSIKVSVHEFNKELLPYLKDESIKNHYLRALLSDDRATHTKLDKNETKEYVNFLCHYFPNEVRRFIMNRDDVDVTEYLEICKSNKIIDALAVIYNKISETSTSFKYLYEYLETKLYAYAISPVKESNSNNNGDSSNLDDALSLLTDILSRGKVENAEEYCVMFIKSFVPPLYKVRDQPEKTQVLCEYLRKVTALSADRMPFDKILEIIVVEFSPLDLSVMRNILCGIINDYDYDIDTSKSLTLLFQQDEIKAQDKYLTMATRGTCYESISCPICKGLLIEGGDDGVKLFECGHIFHNSCLTKQVCPICNPEERIDQDIKRPTSELNQRQIFMRLKRFEFGLAKKPL